MPDNSIDTSKFPNKKFIFGPHFSVFPNYKLENIKNDNNNCKYIQPSEWVSQLWNVVNIILPVDPPLWPGLLSISNKLFHTFKIQALVLEHQPIN